MTPAEYEALALRVETEEPSRKLDAEIGRAIGWRQHPDVEGFAIAPRWTSSLDAAASLMPDGWEVADLYQFRRAHEDTLRWRCGLYRDLKTDAQGTADTEPRARTAAAIRAIAMEKADG